jgi:hypothetical protein
VTLLLAPDQVALYEPGDPDTHGWVTAEDQDQAPLWEGPGNLQAQAGRSAGTADAAGGHGPWDPNRSDLATLFLPTDAPVRDGLRAVIRGRSYALSQARLIEDPTDPTAGIACWMTTATGVDTWTLGGVDA